MSYYDDADRYYVGPAPRNAKCRLCGDVYRGKNDIKKGESVVAVCGYISQRGMVKFWMHRSCFYKLYETVENFHFQKLNTSTSL